MRYVEEETQKQDLMDKFPILELMETTSEVLCRWTIEEMLVCSIFATHDSIGSAIPRNNETHMTLPVLMRQHIAKYEVLLLSFSDSHLDHLVKQLHKECLSWIKYFSLQRPVLRSHC
jgi:hypothetical protein